MVKITFYVTTYAATLKARTDIVKIRHLLDVHKRKLGIEYEEVDLSLDPYRRQEMLQGSNGTITLPQVHVNGKYLGGFEECQEFEDFGELGYLLRGEPIPHNLAGVPHHHHLQQQEELSDEEELLSDSDSSFEPVEEDEESGDESGSEGSEAESGETGSGAGDEGDSSSSSSSLSSSETEEDSSRSGPGKQAASHSTSELEGSATTQSSGEKGEQPASLVEGWVELGDEEGSVAEAAGESDSDKAVTTAAAGLTAVAFAGALAAVETGLTEPAGAPLVEVETAEGSPAQAAAIATATAAASLTSAAFASALAAEEAAQRDQAAVTLARLEGEAATGSPTGAAAADLTAAAFAGALAAAAEAEQGAPAGTVPAAPDGTAGAAAAPDLRGCPEGQPAVAVAAGEPLPAEESETTAVAAAEDTASLSEQLVAEALQSVLKLSS